MGQNYKSKFDYEAWHADLKRKEEEQRQKDRASARAIGKDKEFVKHLDELDKKLKDLGFVGGK